MTSLNKVPNLRYGKRSFIQVNSLGTGERQPPEAVERAPHQDNGSLLFKEKVPALVPDWSIFMQMRDPNTTVLIGPNSMVLIGWNYAFSLVSIDANEDIAPQFPLGGAGLSPLVRRGCWELLLYNGAGTAEAQCGRRAGLALPWTAAR